MEKDRFDLNLLRVLVAVHEASSVTAAAERLGVTQPSVSYALGKLRCAYADPLFVRGASGLVPTAVCTELYRLFSDMLANVDTSLSARRDFDPGRAQRRIRLVMSDIGELYFTPLLLARFSEVAPHMELEVIQASTERIDEDLALGRVDAVIGNLPQLLESTRSTVLFKEHYVCLLSVKHPDIHEEMTCEQFTAARHVMVASPFSGHSVVENVLTRHGIVRRIAVRLPHFTVLPELVANSDLVATLPSRIAALYASRGDLHALPVPVPIPAFQVRVHWHARQEANPFNAWLVAEITKVLRLL